MEMNQKHLGLYNKFNVTRADGSDAPGEKHAGSDYFVLDLTNDQHALPAIAAYASACKSQYPQLAADLKAKMAAKLTADNVFVTVPETTLPNGTVVPSFSVGKYLCSQGMAGVTQINATNEPRVNMNYHEARNACQNIGGQLITELQALAIAHDIAQQAINWTGGTVGEGGIYQGLHLGNFSSGQAADVVSPDPKERRWHQLSNGEQIFDFAGNVYTWVFDDVQGDEQGTVAREFTADSPSIATAPHPSKQKGMGWRPTAGADWSGDALVRGGYWHDGGGAGVFRLNRDLPDYRGDLVGFRCTK